MKEEKPENKNDVFTSFLDFTLFLRNRPDKTKTWSNIMNNVIEFINSCQENGGTVYRIEKLQDAENIHPVLLVSHQLDLTGAPVALMNMAEMLKKMGYDPVVASPADGPLAQQIQMPVIVYPSICKDDLVSDAAYMFELIVCNTVENSELVNRLNGKETPVLWWIHEADGAYTQKRKSLMPYHLFPNITVLAGGFWAKKMLLNHFPHYHVNELLYAVPDLTDQIKNKSVLPKTSDGITTFALIGTLLSRKGQDVLLNAIDLLSESVLEKCRFVFVGQNADQRYGTLVCKAVEGKPGKVLYYPQIDRDDIPDLYQQIDCLICASRDDPMPLVVTEACQFSKLIICSDCTGSASLLKKQDAGFVFENENAEQLAGLIGYVVENRSSLDDLKIRARELYETYFAQEVFYEKLHDIFNQISKRKVSNNQNTYEILRKQEDRIQELQRESYFYQEMNIETQRTAEYATYKVNEIENAFFWRISMPMRKLIDKFKKSKQ